MFFVAAHHRPKPISRQAIFPRIITLSVLLLTLVGCASGPAEVKATNNPVWLTDQKSIQILPTGSLDTALDFQRQVEGRYQKQVYYMNLMLQADATHFDLVAFNSFGNQIFELVHNGLGVQYQTGLILGKIKAEYLVADFQIAFYPEEAVRSMIEAAGLQFRQTMVDGVISRQVSDGDTVIIELSLGKDSWHYQNFFRDYEYTFR